MKVKVTVYLSNQSPARVFVVESSHIWMVEGFLHIKDGNLTYSFSNAFVYEVIQERLNESS